MQAPGYVSGSALQVLQAFPPARLLHVFYEVLERRADLLQEQVMPREALPILLQEEHGYGQHPPQDVCKSVPELQSSKCWSIPELVSESPQMTSQIVKKILDESLL